jgi:hypothetical protein
MLPLYAARIEDLGRGEFVKVDCAACHHIALLTPEFLMQLGLAQTLGLVWCLTVSTTSRGTVLVN